MAAPAQSTMPVMAAWVKEAQTKFARADEPSVNVANAAAPTQPAQ